MIDCPPADPGVRIADRPKFVFLSFKEVRIDRAGANAVLGFEVTNLAGVAQPTRQVPGNVQRQSWRASGECVHLRGIGEFLLDCGRCLGLQKFAEPSAGIGKTPGGQFNAQRIESVADLLQVCRHRRDLPFEISSQLKCHGTARPSKRQRKNFDDWEISSLSVRKPTREGCVVTRVCFLLKVRADRLEEYRRRHQEVWPEMQDALRATGWHNYSLFLRPDGLLVGYLETPDFEQARASMQNHPVNARWQGGGGAVFLLLGGGTHD